jgi:hypothetical protein
MAIQVLAKEAIYFDGTLRKQGDVFTIYFLDQFSKKSMKPLQKTSLLPVRVIKSVASFEERDENDDADLSPAVVAVPVPVVVENAAVAEEPAVATTETDTAKPATKK